MWEATKCYDCHKFEYKGKNIIICPYTIQDRRDIWSLINIIMTNPSQLTQIHPLDMSLYVTPENFKDVVFTAEDFTNSI